MAARDLNPAPEAVLNAQAADAKLPRGQRVDITLEAAWELAAMADVMARELKDAEPHELRFRPMAFRLWQLAGVITSALSDSVQDPDYLRQRLTGLLDGV
jgi:hypothetical protein